MYMCCLQDFLLFHSMHCSVEISDEINKLYNLNLPETVHFLPWLPEYDFPYKLLPCESETLARRD